MKFVRSLSLLLVAAPIFALDEYQPAEEGVIAVDLMNSVDWGLGAYDSDGTLQTPEGNPWSWSPGVQLRLGLPNYTEISVEVPAVFMNKDALGEKEWDWGFYQSTLGFKLGLEEWKVAMVGALEFPMGTEKMVGDDLRWKFKVGGIGQWGYKQFSIDGMVLWTATPADDKGVARGDLWTFVARPQYALTPMIKPYLGAVADLELAGDDNGKRVGTVSHLVTLEPGCFLSVNDEWRFEIQAPVTVKGDWPQAASAGVYVGATLSMGP